MASDLLKRTRPQTNQLIAKQSFPQDWLMNWIEGGDQILVSNHWTTIVRSVMAKLYGTIIEQKISSWTEHYRNKHLVKQALDQNIPLLIIWLF